MAERKLIQRCWKRVKIGDKLEVYVSHPIYRRIVFMQTNWTATVNIIGRRQNDMWLLGTNEELGFWRLDADYLRKTYADIELGAIANSVINAFWIWESHYKACYSKLISHH